MSGTLNVNVLNAIVQRNTEIIGRMELFVVLKLVAAGRTSEYKTRIVKGRKGELATWNERFSFTIPRNALADARLFLEVKDEDVTTDDIVGVGNINLQNCMVFNSARNAYEVRLHYKNEDAGILNVETQWA
jgi:hypothetical protein